MQLSAVFLSMQWAEFSATQAVRHSVSALGKQCAVQVVRRSRIAPHSTQAVRRSSSLPAVREAGGAPFMCCLNPSLLMGSVLPNGSRLGGKDGGYLCL